MVSAQNSPQKLSESTSSAFDPAEADVLIIGAGPAGIQAAIHAARKKVSVVLIGKVANSAMQGTHIENYFGVEGPADGGEILEKGVRQAQGFGCSIINENVTSAEHVGDLFRIVTETERKIEAKSVIIATGIARKKLGVPGEKDFFGKGVSYCASCDCNFYKGKTVVIVGGETEAAVSAELMTRYASKVYWVAQNIEASDVVTRKAKEADVEIIRDSVASIEGTAKVEKVVLTGGRTVVTDGVFIELGAKSSADLAMDMDVMPEMDDSIKVDQNCATSVKGVFACGDVTGRPWQVAKAVGQGAVAGTSAAEYARGV